MLSNETVLTVIIISITVFILLAGLYLNYYLQKEPRKNLNSFNSIPPKRPPERPPLVVVYFIRIKNIETGNLYEKFISINIPTQNHNSEYICSFMINELKLKLISLKEEINIDIGIDINNLKVINIVKIN